MTDRWYEDVKVGEKIISPGKTLTEAEIINWAFQFDPQPFHMDKVAAEEHMYGGLIASGWMLGTYSFRLFLLTQPWAEEASLGSPGIDDLRWVRPVRPGDTIHVEVTVTDSRPSASKPDRGIVGLDWQLRDQNDEIAMTMRSIQLLRRRP
ncbi:MAG: MaoC family dehydratase [Rhodospirillaceae bacterium]|jgi:acyl dehydratase|nr:MaoC family dehydratase [Rhodospirillaceae bacterium]MBT5896885.1 MaoC family dehydratase [Rhodospirillaceae bacterium]MBT6431383.1 MaoC family dehydratase [Rhodospirillaceae bacterium]MBT7759031.1 MaoC family dehydratase [Rhodospirillaceae bacterium]